MRAEDDVSVIIPPNLFDEKKPFLLLEVPYCEINENSSKYFIKSFYQFTNEKYDVAIKWITRKVKSLFRVKAEIHTHHVNYTRVNAHVVKHMLEKLSETWKYVGPSITRSTKNQNHQNM